ncbi:extracellular solute-binding protein [Paenibacillus eucommiae]|uniref:Aldouronate transport system substrate-binding protein n=1 Tax=Paenibacillus eucommiae TaxID=1355755 RepID=A0ABS4J925_9BACL|nr:extracellular solute-binding protein [Paenibacillus eucommiae]MBP1995761.1 putative aldouronate transport system substrate-binding protein [Paenibacillus eucommiae]
MLKRKTRWKGLWLCLLAIMLLAGCSSNKNSGDQGEGAGNTNSPAVTDGSTGKAADGQQGDAAQYGDTGGLKLPLVDKPTTITWMVSSEDANVNDRMIVKEIEKRTGIKLVLQGYPFSTYQDKLKVILASGKLPDIISSLTLSEANKLGRQKALAAINEYADQLPNFSKKYIEENSWVMKSFTDDSNNLYSWPVYGVNRDVNHGFMYRKDLFDQHNIKPWENTEEFYQALKKLKAAYPDSYPYASKTKEVIFSDWAYGWGIGGTGEPYYPAVYDEANQKWKLATTQPEYKEMLDFMKKLYQEGLLDPEFLTDTPESWTAKMTTNDRSFVTFDWIGRLDMFYNQVSSANPSYDLRYGNPIGPTGHIRTLPDITIGGVNVANNGNKEAALKLLDYLISPSGSELITIGVEGETFTWGEDGKPVYPGLTDVPLVDIDVLTERYGLWIPNMYLNVDKRSVYFNYTEKEQEAQDLINKGNKYEASDPILKITDAESATISELYSSLDKSAKEFSAKYVLTDSYSEKEWQDWLKNAERIGASKYIDVYNAAQQRFNASN